MTFHLLILEIFPYFCPQITTYIERAWATGYTNDSFVKVLNIFDVVHFEGKFPNL